MFNKQVDIYNDIFLDILSQKYPPNTILKERDLALKYKTSRTTVRQILQKLSHENKIIINPRSKTIVKKINLEKIQQSFLLRQCLELTVASLIIKKIQRKDLEYLSKNLEKQKEVLFHYNSNTNRRVCLMCYQNSWMKSRETFDGTISSNIRKNGTDLQKLLLGKVDKW